MWRVLLVASGCVAGGGPVIAYGPQASAHVPSTPTLQLGLEALAGPPIALATGGLYWYRGHGLAGAMRGDIGYEGAYKAGSPLGYGGGFELGRLYFFDEVGGNEILGMRANVATPIHAVRCGNGGRIPPDDGGGPWGTSFSVTLSLRWNPRGWAIVLAPRVIAYTPLCPIGSG